MSIMRGGIMSGGIMRNGVMHGGIMLSQRHPIAALFARLGASGFWLDPLDHNQVWADTAGTLHPARGATVARLDAGVHSPVAASFTNGTVAQQPILRADGLEYDAIDDRLVYPDDPALRFGTTDFTLAVAFKPDTVTGSKGLLDKREFGVAGASPGWAIRVSDDDIQMSYDYPGNPNNVYIAATNVLTAGAWHDTIVQLNRAAPAFTAFINDVAQSPVTVGGGVGDISGTKDLVLGAMTTAGSNPMDGTIGRALAIDKLLSDADRAIVNGWLNAGHA